MVQSRIPQWTRPAALLLLILAAVMAGRWAATLAQPAAPPGNWPDPDAMAVLSRYVGPVAGRAVSYETLDARGDGRDPFTERLYIAEPAPAPARAPAVESGWVASAILITNDRRSAVVNDEIVSVGDVVPGGARVVAIERDRVVIVTPAGVRRTLTVQPGGQ